MGMVELAEQSGAVIEGMGFIIEKAFPRWRESAA